MRKTSRECCRTSPSSNSSWPRSIVAAPLRIASPGTTRLPSLMKTVQKTIAFRNFFGRRDGRTGLAEGSFGVDALVRNQRQRQHQNQADRSVRPTQSLKADHDWFWLQMHAPDFLDALLDLLFQGQDLVGA